jgi:glycosyltransferase involved in cell wall biosynthesis
LVAELMLACWFGRAYKALRPFPRLPGPISKADDSRPTDPPRRILSVVNGDWAFLLNRLPMARAARDAGFEVHVATHVNNGGPAIEAEGFVLHAIPFQRDGLSPLAAISAALAIRKLESRIRPSIVHHSGVQCCVFGSLAALGRDLPTVNAITGLGYIFTSVSFRSRLLKLAMIWLLPRLLNRRQSTILVQNPDDRQALIALGAKHITLIPGSGVDTDRLQPLPEPDGPITVGFAGRLLLDKGIRALVAAHDLLRQEGHDLNLIIAGNPDPANPASISREEVQAWTKRSGITWLGHIDDIVPLWRASHIAALPSHREGLPGALMEAAACGRRPMHPAAAKSALRPDRSHGPDRRSRSACGGDPQACTVGRIARPLWRSGTEAGRGQALGAHHRPINGCALQQAHARQGRIVVNALRE